MGSSLLRFETLNRLGGVDGVVGVMVDEALEQLTPADQPVADGLFEYLVTPSGTKIAHTAADLAAYTQVPAATARRVLEHLVRARILRPLPPQPGAADARYELLSDLMAVAVFDWRARRGSRR